MKRFFDALAGVLLSAGNCIYSLIIFVVDTLAEDRKECQRQQQDQLVQQQQLVKLLPYRLGLENRQLQELDFNLGSAGQAVVTLTQQQCAQIAEHEIKQMICTGSSYICNMRNLFFSAGMDVNFGYLRELHQTLYVDALQSITTISYQSATPIDAVVTISGNAYLLIYDIHIKNRAQQIDYNLALQRYLNTQAGQNLVLGIGLRYAEVTCVHNSKLAIAIH